MAEKTPIDETKIDHTKSATGPVEKIDSDTPPQAPKAEKYVPPAGEGEGGAYDPETDDVVNRVLARIEEKQERATAGAKDYKEKKYVAGPAPGDRVVQ